MILSYLLRKLLPWIIEIGLWLTVIAGATVGYGEKYLGSPVLSAALGAVIGFLAGIIPLGMLQTTVSQQSATGIHGERWVRATSTESA
ncbi:MAG: hypothetical protein CM15mP74_14560 [Halieaceae bacterium]|nr:MAG: hypothetical protein CM15mP74_14560 [Halieaceae bacterium]